MGQIQRLTRGTTKPYNSVPRIDWSHPLAAGLATYCYDAGGSIIDLVYGHQMTMGANGTAPFGSQQSQFGRGKQIPLDGWGFMPPFPVGKIAPFGGTAPFSAAMGTLFTGTTGPSSPDSACATIQDAANTEDTFFGFNTFPPTDGTNPNKVAAVFTNANVCTFNINIAPGTFQAWSMTAITGSAQLYYNGAADNTYSGTTTFNSDTTAQVMYNTASINTGQQFGNGANGFIFYFAMWGRPLSAQEHLQLSQDPYCFLIYPEDEIFETLIGVSGGAISLSLATTESTDTAAFTTTFSDQLTLATTETPDVVAFTTSFGTSAALATTETPDVAAFTLGFADQFTLATTETSDAASFTTNVADQFSLVTTEAPDIAAFTTTFSDQFALAVTEASDSAAFNLGGAVSFNMVATETPDTAAFTTTFADQLALATTEAPDVASFNLGGVISLTLALTESPDVAAFVVNDPTTFALATTESPDLAALTATFADQFALTVTEAPDTAAFSATVSDQFVLTTTEAPDVAAFTVGLVSTPVFSLVTTENSDVATFTISVVAPIPPKTRSPIPRSHWDYGWYDGIPMRKLGRR